jgi:CopG family transcriptional regulator, nickel-responsive regulator
MGDISRFGVSVDDDLLKSFDLLTGEQGYATRSEALSDLMRNSLVKARLENQPEGADVLGSLTLVYDHHATDLTDKMAAIQHDHHELVVSVLHVHISHDDCMEVIVLRGKAKEVRSLSDALLSLKGVKHGHLFVTLPGQEITGRKNTPARKHSHPHTHSHEKPANRSR